MKLLFMALIFVGFAWSAGDPSGFHLWTTAELKALGQALAAKATPAAPASEHLADVTNYGFMVAVRKGPGQVEYHEIHADIFVVQSGEATLVYGGKVVDGKSTGPNEIRGASISGGAERKLGAGDIVTIPPKTAHQLVVQDGKEFTYFTIKVRQ